MAASAGHLVAYTIGPIFEHIIDCVELYFTNGFTNIVLKNVNCLWLIDVTLIFDGTLQIIVQRCQIAAPRWQNDISSAADNGIFKNRAQNMECSFGCVARSALLLKPNVANILFNFCEQKFSQHGSITIAIDCNCLSLLIFEKKNGPVMFLYQNPHQTVTRFGCVRLSMDACGFSVTRLQIYFFTYPPKSKWSSSEKIYFFAKIYLFCKSITSPLSEAYTQPHSFGGRIKLIHLSNQTWAKSYHSLNKH